MGKTGDCECLNCGNTCYGLHYIKDTEGNWAGDVCGSCASEVNEEAAVYRRIGSAPHTGEDPSYDDIGQGVGAGPDSVFVPILPPAQMAAARTVEALAVREERAAQDTLARIRRLGSAA